MALALVVLLALAILVALSYNSLARLRLLASNAWADIDVQLKRRHDLIPSLVAVVKGHAGYEKGTLESVVEARDRAASAGGPAAAGEAEGELARSVHRIFALAEAYPDLKAAESFLSLQRNLTEIEDHIQNARRYYNAVVRDFNTRVAQFPSNLVAGALGFRPREFFGLSDSSEQAPPAVGLLLLFLACLVATPAAAQRSLAIERFDAAIAVKRDGSVDVAETITAKFTGSWNGIYRTVPVEYHTPQGFNWTLRLELLGATGPDGQALNVEGERDRHYIKYKIWVPGAEDVTRTVVLRYRAKNGLRFFEDHDELYWNVTGDEWDVPIQAASTRIELPSGATGVRAIAFNGAYGSTAQDAEVVTEGTAVRVTLPQPLGFHEGLTAVVGWDKGLVVEPTKADRALGFLASNWPLGIPLAVLLSMFALWRRVGRDPRRLPVAVRYEAPDSLTPAEAGTLMDESADMRDITATVVDLAVRGFLKIEEREEKMLLGLLTKRDYVFHRLAPPAGAKALVDHESSVLGGIFEGRSEVKLSELDNEFYRHLSGIRESIYGRLVGRGLYRSRPDRVKSGWLVGAVLLGGAIIAFGSTIGAVWLDMTPLPFVIAAIASGLIVAAFGRIMPARTAEGARALERVLGFEEFLRRVEGDRLERVVKTPEMFERFLPFAMAFGVERKWAKAFQDIYREPPTWYVGSTTGPFDLGGFSSRLGDLSSRTSSAMSSSPRSSGGSGFSGGSSGGGSGGGGGGGF